MNIKELKVIVDKAISDSCGDKTLAAQFLQKQCDLNPEVLIAFAEYGAELLDAIIEKQDAVIQ